MKRYDEAKKEMRPEEIVLNDLLKEYKKISDKQENTWHYRTKYNLQR